MFVDSQRRERGRGAFFRAALGCEQPARGRSGPPFGSAVLEGHTPARLRAELHRKHKQFGVDIAAGYEDMRFSAALAHCMERVGIGFDVAAHQAWIARKQEPGTAIEA